MHRKLLLLRRLQLGSRLSLLLSEEGRSFFLFSFIIFNEILFGCSIDWPKSDLLLVTVLFKCYNKRTA